MTKEQYKRALVDPRWQSLRARVLERDQYTCQECKRNGLVLHVHHIRYSTKPNGMPWEVPMTWLVTLCEGCHDEYHRTHLAEGAKYMRKRTVFVTAYSTKAKPVKKSKPKVKDGMYDPSFKAFV